MHRHIPELKGKEEETLFVIGNGFDLYHRLKTSYSDFHDWLEENNYGDFVGTMEKMFPNLSDNNFLLWKDFEEALGKSNPVEIHDKFFQGIDNCWYDVSLQHRVVNRIMPYLNNIPELLREWIGTIPIDVPQRFLLSPKSLYLSFNYTLLLEQVYDIPTQHILHIHHTIADKNPLITGHNEGFATDVYVENSVNKEYSVKYIAEVLNKLRKPVEKIVSEHSYFFDSLNDIKQIVVFGFSISDIDRFYFSRIIHHVSGNAKWHFICHDDKALKYYNHIVEQYVNYFGSTVLGNNEYLHKLKQENCKYIFININQSHL